MNYLHYIAISLTFETRLIADSQRAVCRMRCGCEIPRRPRHPQARRHAVTEEQEDSSAQGSSGNPCVPRGGARPRAGPAQAPTRFGGVTQQHQRLAKAAKAVAAAAARGGGGGSNGQRMVAAAAAARATGGAAGAAGPGWNSSSMPMLPAGSGEAALRAIYSEHQQAAAARRRP